MVLSLLAIGTLASLITGLWRLWHADALAAFFLYQMALGAANLITLGLRAGRRQQAAVLGVTVLWLATLASVALWPGPWWPLLAVAAALAVVVVHRPDMALFALTTLPVSLLLFIIAWRRHDPYPWAFMALLLIMGALFWWRRHQKRQPNTS